MKKVAISLLLFSFILVPHLWAEDAVDNVWQDANSTVYGTKAGGMLGRGLLNAVTCFVDLVVHVVEGSKQGPPIVGTLTGLGSGIACTVLRAGSGVLDIATFWVPGFNGFPVSRSYSNCMELEKEEMEVARKELPAQAPPLRAEDYAKPAAPNTAEQFEKPAAPAKRDVMDYVKK